MNIEDHTQSLWMLVDVDIIIRVFVKILLSTFWESHLFDCYTVGYHMYYYYGSS